MLRIIQQLRKVQILSTMELKARNGVFVGSKIRTAASQMLENSDIDRAINRLIKLYLV